MQGAACTSGKAKGRSLREPSAPASPYRLRFFAAKPSTASSSMARTNFFTNGERRTFSKNTGYLLRTARRRKGCAEKGTGVESGGGTKTATFQGCLHSFTSAARGLATRAKRSSTSVPLPSPAPLGGALFSHRAPRR